MEKTDLISPGYEVQLRELHAARIWGEGGGVHAADVCYLAGKVGAKTILDYGCGRGTLRIELNGFDVRVYDPGVEGKEGLPESADLVVCTDVLEHIEPDKLSAVLEHIRDLAMAACFATVALRPANTRLPDGRNAHLIIDNAPWWLEQFRKCGWVDISIRRVDAAELVVWLRK